MWELDHKEAEHRRIDAFVLWCCRRLSRVPWTARISNQSILQEISPEYSLEGLTLMLQYFGHLMGRADSLEKNLMLGKTKAKGEGDDRGWDGWMASDSMDMSLSKVREIVKDREAWLAVAHGVGKSQTWLSDWTTTTTTNYVPPASGFWLSLVNGRPQRVSKAPLPLYL